jgi:hypothetical protein
MASVLSNSVMRFPGGPLRFFIFADENANLISRFDARAALTQ